MKLKKIEKSQNIILLSINFKFLKNLINLDIKFDKPLTSIMGINGSGKTTILHALACAFKPLGAGENYKFSQFFPPNPDALWTGSSFTIKYKLKNDEKKTYFKHYKKDIDRWTRYEDRPSKDVFFFGIESCVPEIEKRKIISFIKYITSSKNDRPSKKCIELAASILNKEYVELTNNKTEKFDLLGVRNKENKNIPFLSLGAGEQRIIKIIMKILEAPVGSLILIDEIDLLLHRNALVRFLHTLAKYAEDKNLQIVFTTHSLIVEELSDIIDIRYIEQTYETSLVYDNVSISNFYKHTGIQQKPIKIFVEDRFSQAIIRMIARELDMRSLLNINTYGACENAFTLASSYILKHEKTDHILIVIDGDEYKTREEKLERIEKHLTGNEEESSNKRELALSLIAQFNLPIKYPEEYVFNLIRNIPDSVIPCDNEIKAMCQTVNTSTDKHRLISDICERLGDVYDVSIANILEVASKSDKWNNYTENIRIWLSKEKAFFK